MPTPLPASGCGLASAAFCDTFDAGPAAFKGRGGDLDATKWTAARLAAADFSGIGPAANPVRAISRIPACRSTAASTNVYPPFDTLICDPDSKGNRKVMTLVSMQNYGVNSYMIQQPFDFAGRTGKIVLDMDAGSLLDAWPAIEITDDPAPAPTFQEYHNMEAGPIPRNGVMLEFKDPCFGTGLKVGSAVTYKEYKMTILDSSIPSGNCMKLKSGSLNHVEIHLSQNHINVYGSDFSPDGVSMPNLRLILSSDISISFTRAYVRIAARNHATIKYHNIAFGTMYWDNVGFDGPVISGHRTYEVADGKKIGSYMGETVMNLGFILGENNMYDPNNVIDSLKIPGVDKSGATKARLTFNAFFQMGNGVTTSTGLRYRLNGSAGTWRTRLLSALEVGVVNGTLGNPDPSGSNITMTIDVPIGDVINGMNTLEILPVSAPLNLPPAIANVNLVVSP